MTTTFPAGEPERTLDATATPAAAGVPPTEAGATQDDWRTAAFSATPSGEGSFAGQGKTHAIPAVPG